MPVLGLEVFAVTDIVSDGTATNAVALAALGLCAAMIKLVQSSISGDREERRLENEVRLEEAKAQVRIQETLNAHTHAVRELTAWIQQLHHLVDKAG